MTQVQNLNQFQQGPIKGDVSAVPNPTTLPVQISKDSSETFYPGTAVKLIAGQANTILVEKAAATEAIFGFVIFSPKKNSWTAGQAAEVALPGSVMYMESSAAFNRGQLLEQVATGDKVKAWAGSNTVCGLALDTAGGVDQLVRVLVRTVSIFSSSSSSSSSRSSSSSSSSSAAS